MDNALKNLFAITDLRNRVLFTLALLGVYRIGSHIPTPGVNTEALAILAEQTRNTMFGLYDMFSGGNLSQVTIFALGVMPYISSSIILQFLPAVWPTLERISKEGGLARPPPPHTTRGRPSARVRHWLGFPLHVRPDADHGDDVHHVAGRADYRAR